MIPTDKPSKNIKIKWINPFKESRAGVTFTAKLENYVVFFEDGGTLLSPELKAKIIKRFTYQTKSGTEYATQELSGPATELFNFMMNNEGSKKDKFIRTWRQERDKYHKLKKELQLKEL